MSRLLNLDEMQDALLRLEHPAAEEFARQPEALGDAMAFAICEATGVECRPVACEGPDMAGTCVAFSPRHAGDPCPAPIAEHDPGGDWDVYIPIPTPQTTISHWDES